MSLTAVILAGGLGTRLRPIVSDVPKPMAPVKGRPFLERLLDYWIGQGVADFILAVSYQHDTIKNHFGSHYRTTRIRYSVEADPLGTGGAIWLASQQVRTSPFLVINGDSFFQVELEPLLQFHRANAAQCTICLTQQHERGRYGHVSLTEKNRVTRFSGDPDSHWINGGVYLFNLPFFENSRPIACSLENDLFPKWINQNCAIYGWPSNATFIDIGLPDDYQASQTLWKE